MRVLALETATAVCGVAVVDGAEILVERSVRERHAHAERIMGFVSECLDEVGGLARVDGIAVSCGPGSFTGLRIGMSVAKGLAYSVDKPVVGVPTLQALCVHARAGVHHDDPPRRILSVLVARKGEFFVQAEDESDAVVMQANDIVGRYSRDRYVVAGDAAELLTSIGSPSGFGLVPSPFGLCSAATIGMMGAVRLERGDIVGTAVLEPTYGLEFLFHTQHARRS